MTITLMGLTMTTDGDYLAIGEAVRQLLRAVLADLLSRHLDDIMRARHRTMLCSTTCV